MATVNVPNARKALATTKHQTQTYQENTAPATSPISMHATSALCARAPLVPEDAVLVPLSSTAFAWNAEKLFVLSASAFTANTIPAPQWLFGLVCLQNAQIGAVCTPAGQHIAPKQQMTDNSRCSPGWCNRGRTSRQH